MAVDENDPKLVKLKNDLQLLKNDLRACLLSKKNGISIARLLREFEDLTCESLDFRKFGSHSLEDFLRTKCSDVCRFGYDVKNPGIARIIAVANEDTKHIEDLQKNTRQNKGSPPVRRRFSPNWGNNNPYMGQQHHMAYHTSDNRLSSSRFGRGGYNCTNRPWRGQNTGYSQSGSLMGPAPGYIQSRSTPLMGQAPGYTQSRSMIIQAPGLNQSRQVSFTPQSNLRSVATSQVAKQPRMAATASSKSSGTRTRSKPSAAAKGKSMSESPAEIHKKPHKVTRSSWHVYGNYLLPILQKKKFGAMKGDVERDYESKYKECLPDNWVQELDNKLIKIANNYGDGMLLLQALPKETIDRVNQEVKKQSATATANENYYDDITPPSSPHNRSCQEEVEEIDVIIKELASSKSSMSPTSKISAFPTINQPPISKSPRITSHSSINQSTISQSPKTSSHSTINQSTNSSAIRISSHPTINQATSTPPRTINNNIQTSESSNTKRVTEKEMNKLEKEEKLYESKSRYTRAPTHKLSNKRILRRPQLYELANPPLPVSMNLDQRVPSSEDDISIMNENNDDYRAGCEGRVAGRATPTMEERFSKYRDNEEIFWSDDSSVGSDLEWEDQPSFLKSPNAGADCICDRQRTLVFCSFCCFSVGDARVKTVCQVHRNRFEPFDLLVCPQCISEYIVELKETVY